MLRLTPIISAVVPQSYYSDRLLAEKDKLPDETNSRIIDMREISDEVEDAIGSLKDQCLTITWDKEGIVEHVKEFKCPPASRTSLNTERV